VTAAASLAGVTDEVIPETPYMGITDAALWDEADHDPTRYVELLRKQGRVGPQHNRPIAVVRRQPPVS
jgi:hypothetical protein